MTNREILLTYSETGSVRATATQLGISRYEVEKACGIGRAGQKTLMKNPYAQKPSTMPKKISETRLLEENDEETRGRKTLESNLRQIAPKEYVSDYDMRRDCRVTSDVIWEKLCDEYNRNVIIVGRNVRPKIFWGETASCESLVLRGKATYLSDCKAN